jgi:cell division protein FtsI (penicillin-binding protein 3)
LLLAGVIILLVALGVRLVFIDTRLKPRLLEIAHRQQQGESLIPARRGMILDRRGRVVALSRQMPDVFVDPALVDDIDRTAAELSARINRPAGDIARAIRQRGDSRFVVVARRVDEVTAEAVQAMRDPAAGLAERMHRAYPMGDSLAHVIGRVGRDGGGLEGIELTYDEHLRGRNGRRTTIRDARRRALRRSGQSTIPPVDGGHLVLTLDTEIQRIAEEALSRSLTEFEAESGVVIVMSPTSGEILAMASLPAFDPNDPTASAAHRRRNRALTDPVEPGSSFKPLLACGALQDGLVSPTERIDCHMGVHRFGRRVVRDTKPHGLLDLRGIITHSSNIGMGIIAERMGSDLLHETICAFGLGQRTGIELPGESGGVVYPLRRWTSYSPTSLAMGYEVLVTPLQLVTAFAAIVNDGILLKPRLVRQRLGPDGAALDSYDRPTIVRRVVSSDVARYMARELLVSVVENGGGWRAKAGPYRVLGKTGTAKLTYSDRSGYEPRAYQGMFVGAAPVETPRLVALAVVRRPNPAIGYYGGKVAAPVVGTILTQALGYLEESPAPQVALWGL